MIKKLALVLLVAFVCTLWAADSNDEKAAIIKVIEDAYLNGVNNVGDPEAMKKGFHEDFSLKGIRDGKLAVLTISEWIEIVTKNKAQGKYPPKLKTRFEYPMIDITGNTAVVKIYNFRGDKQIFTDYLLLLKFPDGWKITDKIYIRHS
jgi:hypothetical protein